MFVCCPVFYGNICIVKLNNLNRIFIVIFVNVNVDIYEYYYKVGVLWINFRKIKFFVRDPLVLLFYILQFKFDMYTNVMKMV